ncbi:MAG: carbohydrate-binding family 9-like protein, partial [Bacteroidetes bacterium]|nr:carbohydrate-binding family 9-like protein [Bacteroidota bacterium]
AESVDGTVNKRKDEDQSWTVEMAIPFKEIAKDFHPDQLAEAAWRINFYRLNQDESVFKYLAWSPTQGTFHQPGKFGWVIFR